MSNEPVPVKASIRPFSNAATVRLPSRTRTGYVRTIERELAGDIAVMQAIKQRVAVAGQCDRELVAFSSSLSIELAGSLYEREDEITDPRLKGYAQALTNHYLELHSRHQFGYYSVGAQQLAEQVGRPFSPPPGPEERRSWWKRAFGGPDE